MSSSPIPQDPPPHPALQILIDHLHARGRLRVWSIVITIFGDAIVPRGGAVAMTDLLTVTGRMGIEGGALRTAMSRLAKEGWVTRTRSGRTSSYTLSDIGAATFLPASRRIYASGFTVNTTTARLFITEGFGDGRTGAHSGQRTNGPTLRPGVSLPAPGDSVPDDTLVARFTVADLPEWAIAAILSPGLAQDYQHFADLITQVATLMPGTTGTGGTALSPLDALTARILMIHFWRRLILRHPAPPAAITPPDWPGVICHARVSALYSELDDTAEAWWPNVVNRNIARF